jgi:hypothetical protein
MQITQTNQIMKTTIENNSRISDSYVKKVIYATSISQTREQLETRMKKFSCFECSESFIYGFGGSHFWLSDAITKERILIAYF